MRLGPAALVFVALTASCGGLPDPRQKFEGVEVKSAETTVDRMVAGPSGFPIRLVFFNYFPAPAGVPAVSMSVTLDGANATAFFTLVRVEGATEVPAFGSAHVDYLVDCSADLGPGVVRFGFHSGAYPDATLSVPLVSPAKLILASATATGAVGPQSSTHLFVSFENSGGEPLRGELSATVVDGMDQPLAISVLPLDALGHEFEIAGGVLLDGEIFIGSGSVPPQTTPELRVLLSWVGTLSNMGSSAELHIPLPTSN